jgi:hypothetical protein
MQPSAPDRPASIIAFLLNNCNYSSGVAARCVLGLVDEGVLRAEPGPGGALTISLAAASPASGRALRPFEQVTLDRIRSRMTQRADVPLSVLLSNDGEDYDVWRERLTDALGREGERTGLTTQAASKGEWYVWLGLAVVIGLIALIAYQFSMKAAEYVAGFGGVAFAFILVGLFFAGGRWRPTRRGVAAGALRQQSTFFKRLPPDPRVGNLALAGTRFGPGPGIAPLEGNQVWSSFGGYWHPVVVRKPGNTPGRATRRHQSSPDRMTITGEVVKRWASLTGPSDVETTRYLVCIDDGSSGEGEIFDLSEAWYKQLRTGDVARITYDPRRMSVHEIQKVAAGGSLGLTT